MGLQSFKFEKDFMNSLESPIIFIAKKNKEILSAITIYDGLSMEFNLNAYQTISFSVPMEVNGEIQECYEYLEDGRLLMVQGVSWYEIHVEETNDGSGWTKAVTGNSLEIMLSKRNLVNFECNTGEILDEDYVKTVFYNPTNSKGSLLNRILDVTANWTVGHVDESLVNKQRSFDVDSQDVYSFLTGEVAEAFSCLFIFDTFNYTVNAYDLDSYGADTNIFVSLDNLVNNVDISIEENSIFTCYRVNGGEGIQIAEVNPNGTNKIYNFNYYLSELSQELQQKIKSYNEKYQELQPVYQSIMYNMQTSLEKIYELRTRVPSSLASTDWTTYGSELLETRRKSYENVDVIYKSMGYNLSSSLSYSLYQQNATLLAQVEKELSKRVDEIETETEVYNSWKEQRDLIQSQLAMNNWFTVEDWKELDAYVIEETYDNDNFEVVDTDDEAEILNQTKQLLDKATKDLSKKSRPQYQYSSTLYNLLVMPEFDSLLDSFELGNFIRMETNYGEIIKLRLIGFSIDYSNLDNLSVTFSDAVRLNDVYNDMGSILEQASSAATSFQFNKSQYDKATEQSNYIAQMRKYGLDVATTSIHNASDQSQTWDETGMTFRKWNEQKKDYDPEQIKIINNQIVFSDDGFQSAKMAIGKIAIDKNGTYAYGINAEVLMSRLITSENLWIENDSGTYKFDDNGFIATNGTNTVKIQPNKSDELFSIYKGDKETFYIDASGNLHFEGDLTGATGTFSGLVSGGSINIGNGNFTVDKNGNMYASNGTYSGSININDMFTVNSNGYMTATSGVIGGWTINANSLIGYNSGYTTVLTPKQIYFDASDKRLILNSDNLGWEYSSGLFCSLIKPLSIFTPEYVGYKITLRNSSQFLIDATSGSGGLCIKGETTFYDKLNFSDDALANPTYSITNPSSAYLYKAMGGAEDNIPSAGWVKIYVKKYVDNKAQSFYNAGYSNGVAAGYNSGYSAGYSSGYSTGLATGMAMMAAARG